MSKDATAVRSPDAECEAYFADTGTTLPTSYDDTLDAAFESAGYLEDPPDFAPERPTIDITAWNSDEPLRTLLEQENVEVTLKLQQTSQLAIELYWGLGTWESDGGDGAKWTPSTGTVEKAFVLHLTDGDEVLRYVFERVGVSSIGAMSLARGSAISYEVTLKKLADTTEYARILSSDASLVGS